MENFNKSVQKPKIYSGNEEKKMIIHTMPKRFLGIKPKRQNTKSVGIMILILGVFLLLVALAALYFFMLAPQKTTELKENNFFANDAPDNRRNLIKEESTSVESPSSSEALDGGTANKKEESSRAEAAEDKQAGEDEEKPKEIVFATTTGDDLIATGSEEEIKVNKSGKIDYAPALDSDQDGLSDLEEIILDCNINSDDSDGDGYKDLDELKKLYNPAGSGKIIVNSNIEKYTNPSHKYSVYYPDIWLKTNVDGDNSILFRAGNNQYIQIIVQDNTKKQDLEEWYKEQLNIESVDSNQIIYKTGWNGIKSEDGLIAYLTQASSNKIFVISYNVGLDNMLRFKNIFDMIVKSFELTN